MRKIWYESTKELHSQLFGGSDKSIETLTKFLENGKFMSNAYESIDDLAIQGLMLTALLIPVAWGLTPNLGVVVIDAKVPCGTLHPLGLNDLSREDGDKSWECHGGKLYYLLAAKGRQETCSWNGHNNGCNPNPFSLPPGLLELDGKKWGELTKKDIINGALNTFVANGNKNGAKFDGAVLSSEDVNKTQNLNVTAPGVIILPVCDIEEARFNWENYEYSKHLSDHYPCN